MDEYKHACTDCSFKCTNKHDLKVTKALLFQFFIQLRTDKTCELSRFTTVRCTASKGSGSLHVLCVITRATMLTTWKGTLTLFTILRQGESTGLLCDYITTTIIEKLSATKINEISEILGGRGSKIVWRISENSSVLWLVTSLTVFYDGHYISGVTNVTFSQTKKPYCYNTDTVLMRVWQYLQG